MHLHDCCTSPITLSRGYHCCQDFSSHGRGEILRFIAMLAMSQGLQMSIAWEIPRTASNGSQEETAS